MNLARTCLTLLVVLGASSESALPLEIAAGLVAGVLLYTPLHGFPVSRAVAVGGWVVAFAIAVVIARSSSFHVGLHSLAVSVTAAAALGVIAALVVDALHFVRLTGSKAAMSGYSVAVGLGAGAGLLLVAAVDHLAKAWIGGDYTLAAPVGLILGSTALLGALGSAATAGVLRSAWHLKDTVERRFKRRGRFLPPEVAIPSRPARPPFDQQDFAASLAFAFEAFIAALGVAAMTSLRTVVRVIWGAANQLVDSAYLLANHSREALIRLARTLVSAGIEFWRLVSGAAREAARTLPRVMRSSGCTAVALGGAAGLAALASEQFADYLIAGGLTHGLVAWAAVVGALALLAAAWWSTTGYPAADIFEAATGLVESAGAQALFASLVAAWAVGILGLIGASPIKPGAFTAAGSLLLAGVMAWQRFRKRQVQGDRTGPAFPASPVGGNERYFGVE